MPYRKIITPEAKTFIQANYQTMSREDMGAVFGLLEGVVGRYMKENGLSVSRETSRKFTGQKLKGRSIVTPEQDEVIKLKYLDIPIKTFADQMNIPEGVMRRRIRQLGLIIPPEIIEQRKKDSQIQKGATPPNKGRKQAEYMTPEQIAKTVGTRFKKGEPNHNSKFDGCITIRHDHPGRPNSKPHKYIRISKAVWKELQIYNWEQINGPVPKGYILACQDGDTLNCEPDNWKLMTKKDNYIRNSGQKNLPDKFIAGLLARKSRKVDQDLKDTLMQHPDLLELKRQQIILQRTIQNERE